MAVNPYGVVSTAMKYGTYSGMNDYLNKNKQRSSMVPNYSQTSINDIGNRVNNTYPGTDIPYGNIVPGRPASGGGGLTQYDQPTTPTTPTLPYPTAPTVDVGTPQTMSWEDAYQQAFKRANPHFNILRGRTEQQFSEQRERTPQLLAARYGMAGLRGGRRESAESQTTQKEAQAIQELEAQREQAINSLAGDIQNQENSGAYQRWYSDAQLKQQAADREWQQQKAAYEAAMQKDDRANDLFWKIMALQREDEQNAYSREQDAANQEWEREKFYYQDPLDVQYKEAQINRLNKPPASGGGGLTSWQQYQVGRNNQQDAWNRTTQEVSLRKDLYTIAQQMAQNDPRLGNPNDMAANTLTQLTDAIYQDLLRQYGIGGGGAYTEEELMNL